MKPEKLQSLDEKQKWKMIRGLFIWQQNRSLFFSKCLLLCVLKQTQYCLAVKPLSAKM